MPPEIGPVTGGDDAEAMWLPVEGVLGMPTGDLSFYMGVHPMQAERGPECLRRVRRGSFTPALL